MIKKGYAEFSVKQGDRISFADPLVPVRVEAHPHVAADRGRIAIARGPLIYCVEGVDNHGEVDFSLAAEPEFTISEQADLLGGITVIRGKTEEGRTFTAVPLYTWDNRMAGKMRVWLKQKGKQYQWNTEGWADRLYRRYLPE